MGKLEFKEGQLLGVVADEEGSLKVVEVHHADINVGQQEEFHADDTIYCTKSSLPMRGEAIQYTFPGLKEELSS